MKISNYILLSSLLLTILSFPIKAQEKEPLQKEGTFTFKGISLSTDIFGYIGSFLDNGTSGEIAIEANLGDRFFPTFEAGYAGIDIIDENFGIHSNHQPHTSEQASTTTSAIKKEKSSAPTMYTAHYVSDGAE